MHFDLNRYPCKSCGARHLYRDEYQERVVCGRCGYIYSLEEDDRLESVIERYLAQHNKRVDAQLDLVVRKLQAANKAMKEVK